MEKQFKSNKLPRSWPYFHRAKNAGNDNEKVIDSNLPIINEVESIEGPVSDNLQENVEVQRSTPAEHPDYKGSCPEDKKQSITFFDGENKVEASINILKKLCQIFQNKNT